jgi:hypothetical protein
MAIVESNSDNYYKDWSSALWGTFGLAGYKSAGSRGRAYLALDRLAWDKDRELQKKEFEALGTKTVNYGSAITNPADVSGEVTTEEQQAASLAALEEEDELLGKRLNTLGSTSLVGLK